ncbi:uncharacterized protein PFLUO_LOCUS2656 [Penicillium psychrofluorescens]|uniref:uncharacterized protein n=1 Tax=Penicillium psychrofluorescens TaxID=3158075 RepID=UPI003CCDDF11
MSSICADRSPSGLPEQTPTTKMALRQLPEQQASYSSVSSSNLVASDDSPNYSSSSSSDSDELPPHPADPADEDAASNIVGVSIGRAQSRIKACATPAVEKDRVLESNGGYFAEVPDTVSHDGLFISGLTAEPDSLQPAPGKATSAAAAVHSKAPTYPSAEIPGERQSPPPDAKDAAALNQRSSFTRSLLTLPRRPRAWSGELKRFLPDLGSLTKRPSLSFRTGNQIRSRSRTLGNPSKLSPGLQERTWSLDRRPAQNSSFVDAEDQYEGDDSRPISELRPLDGSSAAKHSFHRRPSAAIPGRPPSLRRSSSDQSLYLRASSTASSLEQRPLYENIHSQVNSRFKAIKDSLQDSSSRLLSMPTLHLQDMRTDWSTRPFMPDLGGPKPTAAFDDNHRSRGIETPTPPLKNTASSINSALEEAMAELTGDVVILGGYRGSVLRSAKPPHRQLWVPMKVGLNLRRVDLAVGLTPEAEERMEETIIPSGVLSHVGPVDVCRRLMKRLRKCDNALRGDLRVWDYGYDWRLSPELLSRKLIAFLENLPSNQPPPEGVPPSQHPRGATVIAHSLGGLITRHAVNQRPELFAGVVYAGVPQHCVNILGPMRNGDDVLLSSRVLTAQVNFTFRTSYALLPEDGHCFIDQNTKEEYRIDFFDARTWDEYRLSPCLAPALPPTTTGKGFPLIGKRFSLSVRDEPENLPDIRHSHAITTTDEDITTRNPPRKLASERPVSASFTPNGVVASTSQKAHAVLAPPVEGLVGPTTSPRGSAAASKPAATSTIPRVVAIDYLQRTLTETKRFKSNLAFRPGHQSENRYPPAAVLYGKSVPTVYGARVASRDGIKHQDSYDDLAFAAGDGVCLASAAMLPPGYLLIRGGLVKTDRGHVGLLGDLEGVGQCLKAIIRGRKEGVGLGK